MSWQKCSHFELFGNLSGHCSTYQPRISVIVTMSDYAITVPPSARFILRFLYQRYALESGVLVEVFLGIHVCRRNRPAIRMGSVELLPQFAKSLPHFRAGVFAKIG